MKILLDTQVLIWTQTGDQRLGNAAKKSVEDSRNRVVASVASIWEIGIKKALGKIEIDLEALITALHESDIEILNIQIEHAIAAATLPNHHRDPFDRMLVAQAQVENARLYTGDTALVKYGASVHLI